MWICGVDPGASRAGVALVNMDTGEVVATLLSWRGRTHYNIPQSLEACNTIATHGLRELFAERPPLTIALEQPVGRVPNPSLMMHVGVLVIALTRASGLTPWLVTPPAWKRTTVGKGNADHAAQLAWGKRNHIGGADAQIDMIAAAAIAVHAATTMFPASRTSLAHLINERSTDAAA